MNCADNACPLCRVVELRVFRTQSISRPELKALTNAALAGNLITWHSGSGETTGYCAWARISRESLRYFIRTGEGPSEPGEWDEGYICWIHDVCLSQARFAGRLFQLRRDLARFRIVAFRHRDVVRVYVRGNRKLRRVNELAVLKAVLKQS
jgi:hemolysin-activating ACP:hemolysin acyltransferase